MPAQPATTNNIRAWLQLANSATFKNKADQFQHNVQPPITLEPDWSK